MKKIKFNDFISIDKVFEDLYRGWRPKLNPQLFPELFKPRSPKNIQCRAEIKVINEKLKKLQFRLRGLEGWDTRRWKGPPKPGFNPGGAGAGGCLSRRGGAG
jgi:hypothetical protein